VKLPNWEGFVPKALQTQAELLPLVVAAQQGDTAAMEELAWRVRPLVYSLAIKYGRGFGAKAVDQEYGLSRYNKAARDEMLNEAWVGFLEAVERYNPDHPSGKPFWTVVGYRARQNMLTWQARNSGGVPMPQQAFQDAWHIDKALEKAGVVLWEELTKEQLAELTGRNNAYEILWARHESLSLLPGTQDVYQAAPSAEQEYFDAPGVGLELWRWLQGLDDIPAEHWEEATYWKLEQLGLADQVEAQALLDMRDELLQQEEKYEIGT
jgi:DNA-directed RNA polymerase specialized sigma subunit